MNVSHHLRPHRVGMYLAGGYAFLVFGLFAYTWINTKPENVGYDWIPVYLLTMPWSRTVSPLVGAIINAAVLYLFGGSLAFVIGRVRGK